MKRLALTALFTLLLAVVAVAPASAQAQRRSTSATPDRSTVLKVNVLSPFVLTASGFLEHAFSPNISAQLGAFTTGASIKDVDFKGYGFTPEIRYYISDNAPSGFYVAGYGRVLNYKLTVEDKEKGETYEATYKPIGAGVAAGNQFIFNNGISVDLFLGVGVNGGSLNIKTGTNDDFDRGLLDYVLGSGVRFRPGLTVGYSF
ncbi:DUF3575 domain-containing protein [Pontibacter sp. E15-1]|uniref:DUF3575 domain-containing protein n=1 Tax=Pontibacter sp. E15-1 TaxID=2919918 RepID=UPI001F4FA58D|nr:DUF3575 domain-containing protein [Pontibacter sp. E15-1]MCJ8163733.1 DUF3575 domain-containing protein [Pontibacter sp. E15-1]